MDNGTTQAVVLDNVNAIPVGTLFTPTAAAAINAGAGYNACDPTGCTPPQAASLDNIYNYPGDKAVQKARPFPNYSQILVPRHNTYANYNGLQIEAIKQIGKLELQCQLHILQGAGHSRVLGGLQLDGRHRSIQSGEQLWAAELRPLRRCSISATPIRPASSRRSSCWAGSSITG